MHPQTQTTTTPRQSLAGIPTPMPALTTFMLRHRLPEDVARRVLQIASNVDKADAIAELMK